MKTTKIMKGHQTVIRLQITKKKNLQTNEKSYKMSEKNDETDLMTHEKWGCECHTAFAALGFNRRMVSRCLNAHMLS